MNFAFRYGPSSMNTNPYQHNMYQLPQATYGAFNQSPEVGYEFFLRNMGLSTAQDRTLRQLYDGMWRRYGIDVLSNPQQLGNQTWLQWLGNQNWDRELAELSPEMRAENPNRITGRARWVTYT